MHEIVGGIGGKTRVLVASLRDVVNMQVLAQKGTGIGTERWREREEFWKKRGLLIGVLKVHV